MALQANQKLLLRQQVAKVNINLEKINNAIRIIRDIARNPFVRLFFKGRADKALEVVEEVSGVIDIATETGGLEDARELLQLSVEKGGFREVIEIVKAYDNTIEVESEPKKKTTRSK